MVKFSNVLKKRHLVDIKSKVIILSFFVMTGCVNGILLTTPPDLQMAMDTAEKMRVEAEGRVKLVKNAHNQGSLNLSDFQEIQNAYGIAQDQFSSWIDNVQNDLNSKKLGSQSVNYMELSENAGNQAKEFNKQVDDILGISSRGDEMETIKSFINSGKELINTIKEIEKNKRQELISKLETLRWKSFDSIE